MSESPPPAPGPLQALGYSPGPHYDELAAGDGQARAHWQALAGRLAPLGAEQLAERRHEVRRLLSENGVTYTVYGDQAGGERLWPLDLVPLVIPAEEWQAIEAGVLQRARLLNALLADIYGPQATIAAGHLPPMLLEADPGFLHPCHGIRPPGGIHLHLCGIDLARGADGGWWVLSDRTAAPSGAGYALENRSVIGRVLADCLVDLPVAPLAPFFATLRDGLAALAPAARGAGPRPRTVLLTPGPYNETYFEHVYLAQSLGITLVEGADLTVRDRRVFLKTVSALEPVDVILRRLDDGFCDPLELNPHSALGITGLVEAARAGNVTIANALGSGAAQAAALKPFLPALSRHLLDEELLLPDVASWWCANPAQRDYVLENLHALVVKPAFASLGGEPMFGADLAPDARNALAGRIRARPRDFVGQEQVQLSTAPAWVDGRLAPRPVALRVFVAAGPDGFFVMPGGLTRFSRGPEGSVVSMQRGGGSKDSWLLTLDAARAPTTAPAIRDNVVTLPEAAARRAATGELPSRAGDGLFWIGRYAERADEIVRLLRTLVAGVTDAARPWSARDTDPLINLAIWLRLAPLDIVNEPGALVPLVQAVLADPGHSDGVRSNLQRLHRAAASVRDRLPPDCWRAVTALSREPPPLPGRATPAQLLLRLDELVTLCAALWGAVDDAMPRDAGWRFLEIGKRLERAIQLVAILRGASEGPASDGGEPPAVDVRRLLAAILSLTGARPPAGPRPDWIFDRGAVLTAVLLSRSDPRGLLFQLAALDEHLGALPQSAVAGVGLGLVGRARTLVATAESLAAEAVAGATASRPGRPAEPAQSLRASLARLDMVLPEISNLLDQAYFAHAFARLA